MITGTSGTTTDTLPALINSNVSRALLYGVDFSFEYNFYNNFVVYGTGSYVRGKDTESDTNLPLIPPLKGRMGIRYTYPGIGSAEFITNAAARQDKISAGEQETDGFVRLIWL
jgi:hypothetical protein